MKKFLSIQLTVAMILSLTSYNTLNVYAADVTEPVNVYTKDIELDEGDNVTVTGKDHAVMVSAGGIYEASLKVNGDVSLIGPSESGDQIGMAAFVASEKLKSTFQTTGNVSCTGYPFAYGIYTKDDPEEEKVGGLISIDIGGNVTTEADRSSDISSARGLYASTTEYGTIDASVGGNVSAYGATAFGIETGLNGKISVVGNVTADSNRYDSDNNVTDPGLVAEGAAISSRGDTAVDISGSIYSTGVRATGAELYLFSAERGKLDLNVGKDIIVNGTSAVGSKPDSGSYINSGILLYDQDCGDINADIKGDIIVSRTDPEVSSAAIRCVNPVFAVAHPAIDGPYSNNVRVHGNVISDDVGIYLSTSSIISNILIEGTLNGANRCVEVDQNSETHITAWKMIPNERGHLVEFVGDTGDQYFSGLERSLNYIIRTEQPSAGGTFTVVKEDGTALDKVEEFEVAHEGDKVYIKPELEDGLVVKAAYNGDSNGKTELSKDDGGYYLVVPKGGGVNISIEIGAAPTPSPTPTPTPTLAPSPTPSSTPDNGDKNTSSDDITKEIPFAENIPVEEKQTVIESANTDKNDVAGSTMKYLELKAAKVKKNSIKLSWKKVKGADGYIIYGGKCGKKMKYITTIKKTSAASYTAKKLKKGKYYKYVVVAYKTTASGGKVITTSKSVHAATTGGKVGNPTSIKVKKTKVSLKRGKTANIKASFKKKKKVNTHIAKFRYESLDESIATVSKSGKIKAVSKGKTKILVYTQNGLYKNVSVTVK